MANEGWAQMNWHGRCMARAAMSAKPARLGVGPGHSLGQLVAAGADLRCGAGEVTTMPKLFVRSHWEPAIIRQRGSV